ncbi:MAG: FliH/SctL family protein [Planctomycetota bacterium]|nr:FliH/SctL family protein [Planctomycetota bacterium]
MSRNPILLPTPPTGIRLVERDLSGWFQDQVADQCAAARAEGYAEAMAGAAGALEEAAARIDVEREEAVNAISGFATRFACEVAKHLLRISIQDQAHDIESMVRATLAEAGVGRGKCVVHLNPQDAATLAAVKFRSGTEVESDPSVPHGSVQITTPRGLLVRDVEDCIRHAADRIYGDMRNTVTAATSGAAFDSSEEPEEPEAPGTEDA